MEAWLGLNFDPWGRRRNPVDWTYNNVPASFKFDRGYTGHEHLDKFGLINMNGRMFDPFLARFLSPDPFITDGSDVQAFNSYSYCMNNPLNKVDPTGYFSRDDHSKPLGDPYEGWMGNAGTGFESGVPVWNDFDGHTSYWNSGKSYGDACRETEETSSVEFFTTDQKQISMFLNNCLLGASMEQIMSNYYMDALSPTTPAEATFEDGGEGDTKNSNTNGNSSYLLKIPDILSGGVGIGQLGMLDNRYSLDFSRRIGTFPKFYSAYSKLSYAGRVLKYFGYGATIVDFSLNSYAWRNGDLSTGRYVYRTTGTLSSLIGGITIGWCVGGPWGAVGGLGISLGFDCGERLYDVGRYVWNETSLQLYNFERALNSGWYPGK